MNFSWQVGIFVQGAIMNYGLPIKSMRLRRNNKWTQRDNVAVVWTNNKISKIYLSVIQEGRTYLGYSFTRREDSVIKKKVSETKWPIWYNKITSHGKFLCLLLQNETRYYIWLFCYIVEDSFCLCEIEMSYLSFGLLCGVRKNHLLGNESWSTVNISLTLACAFISIK